jgi:hypothetical protein
MSRFVKRRDSSHSILGRLRFLLHAYIIALSKVSQKALIFSQITHKSRVKCCVMTLAFFHLSLPFSTPFGLALDPASTYTPLGKR